LDAQAFEKAIRNSSNHTGIVILPVLDISPKKIKRLKEVYSDVFHKPINNNEAKAMANEFSTAVTAKYQELNRYMERLDVFPFLVQLKPVCELLHTLQNKSYDWYYSSLDEFETDLLDLFEHRVDPILGFLNGAQKNIYVDARKFLIDQQYNLSYVDGEEIERLKGILADENCFRGNHMTTAKELVGILSDKINRRLDTVKEAKLAKLDEYHRKLKAISGYEELSQEKIDSIEKEIAVIQKQLLATTQISMLNDQFSRFESYDYPQLAFRIKDGGAVAETPPISIPKDCPPEKNDPPVIKPKTVITVSVSRVKPQYRKSFLEDQKDVEEYVQAYKVALFAELAKGNSLLV
jgi:hypothetical protein